MIFVGEKGDNWCLLLRFSTVYCDKLIKSENYNYERPDDQSKTAYPHQAIKWTCKTS